jgi:hypothetical protein
VRVTIGALNASIHSAYRLPMLATVLFLIFSTAVKTKQWQYFFSSVVFRPHYDRLFLACTLIPIM